MSTRKQSVDGAAHERVGPSSNGTPREGLAREHVTDIQRARILSAMVEVVCERGAGGVSVAHVVERAGVSRRTFYEVFDDREDCFLAAFDEALLRVAGCVLPVYEAPLKWRERIRASLVEFLSFLDGDPGAGRLLVVETLGAGHRALARRKNVLAQIIEAIDEGRAEAKTSSESSPLTGEGVIGAVLAVISGRIVESDPRPLVELTNPLMSMIVLPYLGAAAARRELDRPVPKASQHVVRATHDPLRDIEMRLTYRTVRVLVGLHDHPGASNRQVGDVAGIPDQGQVSKLLTRLTRLGLIRNTVGGAPGRGAPNAWMLTAKGQEVQDSLRSGYA